MIIAQPKKFSTPNLTACSGMINTVTAVTAKPQRFRTIPRLKPWREKLTETPETMMNAKQILTEKIMRSTDLGEAISAANDELCQRNEAGMFVTAWIGILDLTCGKVEYVNAGHNPPLMCTGAHAEYMITRSGLVLAGMEGIRYRQNSFELKPGDMLFLYTDGVTEAENKTHEQLGEDALKELLDSVSGSDTEQVVAQIRDKISEHVAGFEQSDDITMLCIRLESRSGDQGSGE